MCPSLSSAITLVIDKMFRFFRIAYVPYCGDYYGLGNRIKGLANFYSRGYRRFLMLWNTESWVTDRWDNLFELRGARVCAVNSPSLLYSVIKTFLRRFVPLGVVREETPFWSFILPAHLQREEFRHRWSFSNHSTFSVDWLFNRTPNDVKEYYRRFFSALSPSELVLRRIPQIADLNLVGVQIRNTDIAEDEKDVASIESIFGVMEQYPKECEFFISCMTKEVSIKVHERFGNRVVELKNKDYSSMIDAVADMWILAHCPEMIVSPQSTFSEVAWWWGGCKSKVTMLETEYNQATVVDNV